MYIKDVKLLRALADREGLELGHFLARIAEERNKELKGENGQRNN
jgi:hypothetical protein